MTSNSMKRVLNRIVDALSTKKKAAKMIQLNINNNKGILCYNLVVG